MKREQPLVSIITVNYNQIQVTTELLESLRDISFQDFEIILVDNGSTKNPTAFIRENYPEVHLIVSQENLGFSGGNNLGIQASRGEYLFFINNDAAVTEGCIETLLQLFSTVPSLGIVSPKICYDPKMTNDQRIIQYVGATHVHPVTARNEILGEQELDTDQYLEAKPTAYVHGAAMMTKRTVIDRVGQMPNEFFLYYEELDWSEQIRNAGYEVYVEPRALVFHKESLAVGKKSTLKTYYHTRNRIFFVRRNRTAAQITLFYLFLFFFTIPKNTLVYLKNGEWNHIQAFYKGIWWNLTGHVK
ncbi:MAG: glycosyltransferase family 2 protein [Bacteroidota bacterium]